MNSVFHAQRIAWINFAFLLFCIGVRLVADIIPINGVTNAQVRYDYFTYLVPAPYTFLIRPVIAAMLLMNAISVIVMAQKRKSFIYPYIRNTQPFYVLIMILYSLWVVAFHYHLFLLATCLLLCVIIVSYYLCLQLAEYSRRYFIPAQTEVLLKAPFSLLLGWVTVVAIAGIAHLFTAFGWSSALFSPYVIAILLMSLILVIALVYLFRMNNMLAVGVIAWTFYGYSNQATSMLAGHQYFRDLALAFTFFLILSMLVYTARNWYSRLVTY